MKETSEVMAKTRKWEATFSRYIEAQKRYDALKASGIDGRALHGARRSLRAARRQMEAM